jgi:predicted metal-dependent HD superfamily phosphohydrolase
MGNDLLVHYANKVGATHIIRGIRSHKDFDDESLMQRINKDIDDSVETMFFIPNKQYVDVSSSLVKALIGPKYWHYVVKKYVPEQVFNALVKKEFIKECKKVGLEDNLIQIVYEKYSEKHRKYHNVTHILDVLFDAEIYAPFQNIVKVALLYHDIDDSELNSCAIYDLYHKNHEKYRLEAIRQLIMATDHSREDVDDFYENEKITHDIDLMILSSNKEVYDQYAENVFQEYASKLNITREEFNPKRKEFLQKMLYKPRLYLHEKFMEHEYRAKANISREWSKY